MGNSAAVSARLYISEYSHSKRMLQFSECYYQPVSAAWHGVQAGDYKLAQSDRLECGMAIGTLTGAELRRGLANYARQTRAGYRPPLAALVYCITGAPAALDTCFPLAGTLGADDRAAFHALAGRLASTLDIRLFDAGWRDVTDDLPRDAAYLIAGQIAEIFVYRQDILERLQAAGPCFRLYTTPGAFAQDGGVAGGCYNPASGSVQLLLARLYEGFYAPTPGVAPLLHEFGHLLDHFDAGSCILGASSGLLPGLRPTDGAIYTPLAREQFLEGKRIELERYLRRYVGAAMAEDPLPIGHPYVFQNDTEFIAGYLEMFFRNPHAFAGLNPSLYAGFAALLRQDPRAAWAADFPFYIAENQRFYHSGQLPGRPGLTLPNNGSA
jgi:hypothetical protein